MALKVYLVATAVVFSLVALIHLLRVLFRWDVVIAGWPAPLWLSWLALVVLVGLIIFAIKLIRKPA